MGGCQRLWMAQWQGFLTASPTTAAYVQRTLCGDLFKELTMMINELPSAYDLLCEARELLGRAHDKIATATMNYGGPHNKHLVGVCPQINQLIEQLHDACGAC
jgi:hypothetical protein